MKSQRQELQDRRRALQERLRALCFGPLMRGSVSEVRRRCGRSNCVCAKDPAARHPRTLLTVNLDGRGQAVHLRSQDIERVHLAVASYNELWEIVNALTACEVADLKRQARERRRGHARRQR